MMDPSETQEWINRWLVIALCGGITLLAMGAAMGVGYAPLAVAIIVLGGFVVTVVHELGHAIAAWALGWRVWIFHAAPFAWRRADGKIHFEGSLGGPDIAGFVLAAPRTARQDTKLRDVLIGMGGPLASWLIAAALIGIALFGAYDFESDSWRAAFYALGLLSLAAAIGTSLPVLTSRGEGNDAMHILDKLNHPHGARDHAEVALWLWQYGVEQADWDEDLRSSVETARKHPTKAFVPGFFDFIGALRNDDGSAARRALAAFGGVIDDRHVSILEAYVDAALDGDGASADRRLATIPALDDLDEGALVFRELALVELSRLSGEHVQLTNA